MTIETRPPDYRTLDNRIKAVFSDGARLDQVTPLIQEAKAAAISFCDAAKQARSRILDPTKSSREIAAFHREMDDAATKCHELQDAVERLREYLRDEKTRKDRCRLLAKIAKIVGPRWLAPIMDKGGYWTPKAIVEAELFRLAERCDAQERNRTRGSKDSKRAIKQFGAALRKANSPKLGLPPDFRLLLRLDQMIYMFEAYEKKAGIPKRDAYAKRMAALSAKYLCETFGIPLRTTRKTKANTSASVFCRLAAVLFGDERADLQHYCLELVKARQAGSANPGQK